MNLEHAQNIVIALCKKAGEDLKNSFTSGTFITHSKGGVDFATQQDDDIDTFLRNELRKAFPQTELLTEETAGEDFLDYPEKEYVWVIDPIDGTTNFSRGNPHFGISVGLVTKGVTILGVVYLPVENLLYTATLDEEPLCNGKPIRVSKTTDLKAATVAVDFSWDLEKRRKTYEAFADVVTNIRQPLTLGSAAADICLVASGKLDGYVQYGIKPWDHAAANLILTKAGGKVTTIDGSTWNIFDGEILATNGLIHKNLLELL